MNTFILSVPDQMGFLPSRISRTKCKPLKEALRKEGRAFRFVSSSVSFPSFSLSVSVAAEVTDDINYNEVYLAS